jgi:hypothetical protein
MFTFIVTVTLVICQILRFFHRRTCKHLYARQQQGQYNKHVEIPRSGDVGFHSDDWMNFQALEAEYEGGEAFDVETLIEQFDDWSQEHFNRPLNYKIVTGQRRRAFVSDLHRTTTPRTVIKNGTHLVLFFPDEHAFVSLMDHYYCDGLKLLSFMQKFLGATGELKDVPIVKYKSVPFLSDVLIGYYLAREMLSVATHPPVYKPGTQTGIYKRRIVAKAVPCRWSRWSVIGEALNDLFTGSKKSVSYLRVALTVSIDTDQVGCNNRIGAVIVVIDKPQNFATNTHKHNLECLASQLEERALANRSGAMLSYDTMRSYNTKWLRHFFSNSTDVVVTSFRSPVDTYAGGHGIKMTGFLFGHSTCYVNLPTQGSQCDMTLQVGSCNWDDEKFLKMEGANCEYMFG